MITDPSGLRGLPLAGKNEKASSVIAREQNQGPSTASEERLFSDVFKARGREPQRTQESVRQVPGSVSRAKAEPKGSADLAPSVRRERQQKQETQGIDRESSRTEEATASSREGRSRIASRDVVLKFMDSIESELGIPPESLLAAMASQGLSLQVPPSIARMESVMGDLDLNPHQAGKALELYSQVLQASNWGQSDSLKESKTGFPGMLNAEIGSASGASLAGTMTVQQHRAHLNQLVDQVNSKFFMNSDLSSGGSLEGANPMQETSLDSAAMSQGIALPEALQSLENPSFADSKVDFAKALNSSDSAGNPSVLMSLAKSGGEESLASFDQSNQQSLEGREASSAVSKDAGSPASGSIESLAQRFFSPQAFSAGVAAGASNTAVKAGSGFGAESDSENIQQILDRAQVMIRKGGGEASVKLSPEGLGDLHLKVVIQDGKVNVEMAAETREAKKLLESSLADLKSQLSAHKLSLESVKVDVANPNQFDSSAQAKMDSRQDQNREGLMKFFQQFRDEGSFQQRSQFYEMPELRAQAYRRAGPQALGPEPVSTSARRAEGRGSSLNLVA